MDIAPPRSALPKPVLFGVVGVLLAFLVAGLGVYVWLGSDEHRAGQVGGPFTLLDGDGKSVSDTAFRGRYMLVYFGYTYCPDVCPTTLTTVAQVIDKLGAVGSRVQPIFITVDPQRDTPAVMKQYVGAFSPRLVGLTGSSDAIANVAREYKVYYAINHAAGDNGAYTVDHSSILYLVGPDGRFIEPIPADATPDAMAQAIRQQVG
jgi:protein SCO1